MENKGKRARRYKLELPAAQKKPWSASGQAAMKQVLGKDDLGRIATSLFQSALTFGT